MVTWDGLQLWQTELMVYIIQSSQVSLNFFNAYTFERTTHNGGNTG